MSKKKKESFKKEPQLVDDASQIKAKRVKAVPEKKKYNNPKKWLQALDEEDDYEQWAQCLVRLFHPGLSDYFLPVSSILSIIFIRKR